ncbi:MAG: glutathione peroxidase [Nannocystis sp.]|uniref:glutathione peroxidase n=1 Tax=Nannocystis sp. TaxID=1962667 RepID=UPI0024239DF9|nr:glutathione peroxidase [Nannocystis sp.]MBK9753860.1 glutathione peroxidase [Nannocystis sp.]
MLRSTAVLVALSLVACGAAPAAKTEPTKTAPTKTEPTKTDAAAKPAPLAAAGPILDHSVETLEGSKQSLADYRGKAVLLVNVASECGYTPQYAQLQELYGRYKDRGLVVLGFPSNDFGGQEPGDAAQIKEFVTSKYAVDFPMMAKVHAKGPEIAPLYKTLSEDTPDGIKGEVKWNFTKFLVDPSGKVIARFESAVEPMGPELTAAVEKALPTKTP